MQKIHASRLQFIEILCFSRFFLNRRGAYVKWPFWQARLRTLKFFKAPMAPPRRPWTFLGHPEAPLELTKSSENGVLLIYTLWISRKMKIALACTRSSLFTFLSFSCGRHALFVIEVSKVLKMTSLVFLYSFFFFF